MLDEKLNLLSFLEFDIVNMTLTICASLRFSLSGNRAQGPLKEPLEYSNMYVWKLMLWALHADPSKRDSCLKHQDLQEVLNIDGKTAETSILVCGVVSFLSYFTF